MRQWSASYTGSGLLNGESVGLPGNITSYSQGLQFQPATLFLPTPTTFTAGNGTLPNAARNTLPIRPINNIDLSVLKRVTVHEHYSLEFGAGAFNVLNHAQYIPGTVDNVNATSYTANYNFQTVRQRVLQSP